MLVALLLFSFATRVPAQTLTIKDAEKTAISRQLKLAGENRSQIERALAEVRPDCQEGMKFLVRFMPQRDLTALKADFLIANVEAAYDQWQSVKWAKQIPKDVFLNNVLPYASINERRDDWRVDFRKRFGSLVEDCETPGQAGAILNQKIFKTLNVKYSTKRRRADQAPYESIESGLASCTGLSVLLIDACRANGVPARFVGTPLWSDRSGNHSWVEIWNDGGWHFTGAAEASGDALDKAWFIGRASKAQRDHRLHAIYAVSFKHTPITFPLVWDRRILDIYAVNVTSRYTKNRTRIPDGYATAMFVARRSGQCDRCTADLNIIDESGKSIFTGKTNDERFDANDHVIAVVPKGKPLTVIACEADLTSSKTVRVTGDGSLTELTLLPDKTPTKPPSPDAFPVDRNASAKAVDDLAAYLAGKERGAIEKQDFAGVALTLTDATVATRKLWDDHVARIKRERADEMDAKVLKLGELKMPFFYKVFGEKPPTGRSLYISMHGGGGAPKRVNDSQWENQKRLYKPEEGVYLAPRAPTDTWNLWHQPHIDQLYNRLIENLIVFEDVNPDRVYIMGYSAGGDGVYQLAPRMADRWAAAAMMAGHPNDASPLSMRNIGFTLHVGGKDGAYKRNQVAAKWKERLAELHKSDPDGYRHDARIHADKGHWMDREDAVAVPWMAKFTRNAFPKKIVWHKRDNTHSRFYWLSVDPKTKGMITATREKQTIDIKADGVDELTICLSSRMINMDAPITVTSGGKTVFDGLTRRTIQVIAKSLAERGDLKSVCHGEVTLKLDK